MPDTISPNPPSPFADADAAFRHLIPAITMHGVPDPGVLAVTACERLAVVPDEQMRDAETGVLPDGLCPACLAAMHGKTSAADNRPIADCRTCDGRTQHDGVCALCRQEMHADWVAAGRPDGVTVDQTVERTLADVVAEYFTDDTSGNTDNGGAEQQGTATGAPGGER